MTDLPGVPYAHTQPSLAFKAGVTGFVPEPDLERAVHRRHGPGQVTCR